MQQFFSHKYAVPATLLLILSATVAFGVNAYKNFTVKEVWEGPTIISVSGYSEVMAVPDVAQFNFSVMAKGDTAAIAGEASAKKINVIMTFLKESGVEEKDIKTQGYNLFPKYRYEQRPCSMDYCPPAESIQDGFEVSQTITVKVRNTEMAGDLLSGVGQAGATNMSGLEFSIDDTNALKQQAREEAIGKAKAEAKALATALGVHLGKMTNYYEDESSPMPYYAMGGDRMKSEVVNVAPDVPTGENSIISNVHLSYEIY